MIKIVPSLERKSDSYYDKPYTIVELVDEPPLEEVADVVFFQKDPEA